MRCACSGDLIEPDVVMESLYILIPISVLLVFVIGAIFWWSLRSGQFDDMEGPAYRVLLDDRDRERKPDSATRRPPASGHRASREPD